MKYDGAIIMQHNRQYTIRYENSHYKAYNNDNRCVNDCIEPETLLRNLNDGNWELIQSGRAVRMCKDESPV